MGILMHQNQVEEKCSKNIAERFLERQEQKRVSKFSTIGLYVSYKARR